jgi:phage terminase large subunit-like protein
MAADAGADACPVRQYAIEVDEGRILANKWVRLACRRHLQDLERGPSRGLFFDPAAAADVIEFFETCLVFYEGEFDGKPFLLEPFQKFIVGSLFGWKTEANGSRRFRTAYIEMAKGQGKSPVAAGVGLYGLVADGESGAEIYSAATTRDQAGILFRDAKAFAEGSPALMRRLSVDKGNIAYPARNSFFRPVSSEHRGLDGKRPHIALIDEVHEHPGPLVVNKMRAGTKNRRQALIFEITNAGYDRHSICYQHHEYSEKILEGVIDNDAWFAYMTGLDVCEKCAAEGKSIPADDCPDCDSWKDESKWIKANPGLDTIIPRKYLQEQVAEAVAMPSNENIVKRLNFCIWTESVTKWLSLEAWAACAGAVDPEALRGRTCYGGLDLSSTLDLTAWVLVFPPDKIGGKYSVLCRFFLPEDNMEKRVRKDKVPYDVWSRQGFITLTPGNIIDYAFILATIKKDTEDYDVAELAFDRWGSQKITTDLQDIGFEVEGKKSLIQFGQGFASMAAPTKELEKMVMAGELAHGGNPVLAWMASNTVVRKDPAGNMKPDKEKSTERIDGIVATIMAVSRAMLQNDTASVYESRGVLTFGRRD